MIDAEFKRRRAWLVGAFPCHSQAGPTHVVKAMEIKASKTPKPSHFATLDRVDDALGLGIDDRYVVYDGSERLRRSDLGIFLPWSDLRSVM